MKNLKEVDWSKAPEGATHYNEDCACPWLKETPPSYYVENKGAWVEYASSHNNSVEHIRDAVKRPQEWDGSGVPPVGTVCEYRLNDGTWFTCKITYVLSGSYQCFVAWCDHLDSDQFLSFASDRYKLQLREIKTPEQRAAEEERLQAIDGMLELLDDYTTFKDVMGKLYDAGYRKTNMKK